MDRPFVSIVGNLDGFPFERFESALERRGIHLGKPGSDLPADWSHSESAVIVALSPRNTAQAVACLQGTQPSAVVVAVLDEAGDEAAEEALLGAGASEVCAPVLDDLVRAVKKGLARRLGSLSSEARFRRLLDAFHSFAILIDSEGRVLFINQAFADATGVNPADALGRNAVELFCPPEDRTSELAILRDRVAAGRISTNRETRVRRADGSVMLVNWSLLPRPDESGRVASIAGIGEDVTERRRFEETLKFREEKLFHAQKIEAIGQLAGGIAHDFNNLLTILRGHLSLVQRDTGRRIADVRDNVETMSRTVSRATALTSQLLAFSREDSRKPTVVELNGVIRNMTTLLGALIGEGITFDLDLATDLHPVLVDPSRFEQALMNLAVNARDAMDGVGFISVVSRNHTVVARDASGLGLTPGEYVAIDVSDTGCGIPPDITAKIFDPYFSTKRPGKGTGLGLATTRSIIERAGGHISVSSVLNEGTTFTILLPRSERPAGTLEEAVVDSFETPTPPSAAQERILVVDDEPDIRAIIQQILTITGFDVTVAASAEEAQEAVAAATLPFDLILADVMMPLVTGPELVRRLAPRCPGIPVLYMSAQLDEAVTRYGLDARAPNTLAKPFSADQLVERIHRLIRASRKRSGAPPTTV